jgi:hypothetical protein
MTEAAQRKWVRLELEDFVRLFGTTVHDIPEECKKLITQGDFRYQKLSSEDLAKLETEVQSRIESGQWSVAGSEGKARWEKGWGENLQNLIAQGGDVSQLVPKYIRPNQPVRLDQTYVQPADACFELNWYEIFRLWLFQSHFEPYDSIYEFGCGSGFNLVVLAKLFANKKLYGMDWAAPSRDIVNKLAEVHGWKMEGRLFDFFAPDPGLTISPNSVVFTIGALEQTGRNYESFLQYLLNQSPALCIHVEPICEWYDEQNKCDSLAILFHRKRKYWEGFPDRLRQLEAEGRIQILKMKRSYFGSLYIEGYSQIIWRPTKRHS